MRMRDIKDRGDLRDLSSSDLGDLLDELRAIATKRGTELLRQGRVQAWRAMGPPDQRAIGWAFITGVAVGAAVGAAVAILMAPMPGREARQRLAQQAGQVRERLPDVRVRANGRARYTAGVPESEIATGSEEPIT